LEALAELAGAYVYAFAVDEKRAPKKPRLLQHQRDQLVVAEGFGFPAELLEGR
jgi:hypothetical protein